MLHSYDLNSMLMEDLMNLCMPETTTSTVYYRDGQTLIGWIEEDKILYVHSHGVLRGEEYRMQCIQLVQAVIKFKATKVLCNIVDFEVIVPSDQQWTAKVMAPLLIRAGLQHAAYVLPVSLFTRFAINRIQQAQQVRQKDMFAVRAFEDEAMAHQWLKSV